MPARILVVEDDPDLRLLLGRILKSAGFSVVEAGSGADAIDALSAGAPDLAILDLRLPDTDGISLLRRLRGLKGGGRLPVIFCTIRDAFESLAEAHSLGAVDYVLKPFEERDLLSRVRRALETRPG